MEIKESASVEHDQRGCNGRSIKTGKLVLLAFQAQLSNSPIFGSDYGHWVVVFLCICFKGL